MGTPMRVDAREPKALIDSAGVTRAAGTTGAAASQVLASSSALAKQGETLRGEVDRFLADIRAA